MSEIQSNNITEVVEARDNNITEIQEKNEDPIFEEINMNKGEEKISRSFRIKKKDFDRYQKLYKENRKPFHEWFEEYIDYIESKKTNSLSFETLEINSKILNKDMKIEDIIYEYVVDNLKSDLKLVVKIISGKNSYFITSSNLSLLEFIKNKENINFKLEKSNDKILKIVIADKKYDLEIVDTKLYSQEALDKVPSREVECIDEV